MTPETLVFGPVILPLLGAALIFCAKAFLKDPSLRRFEYIGVFIGLALPWVTLAYTAPLILSGETIQGVIGGWNGGVGIMFRFDGLAWLVNILGFSVAGAAWIYSVGGGPRGPSFSSIFLIQTAALAATIMTADLFNLFVCLEVLGIASYVLVASNNKPGASLASFSYLMVSAAAMVFFLIGLYGLYRLTGSLSYQGIASGLQGLPEGGGVLALVSLALVVSAVAMRVAVMPLYGWLPDAHALAPHAVSAVLSGVLIKTPLFALSRVLLLMPAGAQAGELLGYAGAATALVGVIIALSQKDAKRLLAYHSISQIGYIVSAWGAAIHIGPTTPTGLILMTGAFLHAFYHALFKGLLFLSIGTTTDYSEERNVYVLRGATSTLRRAGEKFPLTLLAFLVGALAISAIPPLNGYVSKAALTYALKGNVHYYLLTAASVGTVASFIKLSRIYLPGKRDKTELPAKKLIPRSVHLSQAILALLCILGGLGASRIYSFVGRIMAGSSRFEGASIVFYSTDTLLKTLLVTVAGAGLFALVITKPGTWLLTKIRERPQDFQGLFISFALGTAALLGWLLLSS